MTNIFNLLLWVIKEINDVAPLFPCSTATSNISDSMTIYMASQLAATITAITCEAKTTEMKKKRPKRRKHCALAVVRRSQKFCPVADPFPGRGTAKFNQLEMVTTFTYKPSLVRINARNLSCRGNRPTNTHTNAQQTNPQTGPITIHCSAAS